MVVAFASDLAPRTCKFELARMSGTMYSSLRYLLPAQASGEEWSSRLAKRETAGAALRLRLRFLVSTGRGWMGEGDGYSRGYLGSFEKVSGREKDMLVDELVC